MKKCYIAGKIGSLEKAEYERNFEQAKREVEALGFQPVSPVDFKHDHDKTWQSYMKEDVRHLLDCEALYAIRNWRTSPGATIEINIALQLGIDIIHQPMKANKNHD